MSSDSPSMPAGSQRLVLASRREEVDAAMQRLLNEASACRYGRTSCFAIRLALEEAMSNALRHGNRNDPSKVIVMRFEVTPQDVRVEIADEGDGFDPASVPDPTRDENIAIPSGRGLMLMRSYMSEVRFNQRGNCVFMQFRKPA